MLIVVMVIGEWIVIVFVITKPQTQVGKHRCCAKCMSQTCLLGMSL